MIPDHRVRQLLVDELERNVMVDASAGSGKTQSLSMRMAEGLLRGVYAPDKMAAVTFTRKAASELRGRLQLVLERALRDETDSERRRRAANGLEALERMFVGTIHSFCARLLREYPVEAGISPGFRELDPLSGQQILSRVFRRVLSEAPEQTLRALSDGAVRSTDLLSGLNWVCINQDAAFAIPGAEPRPDTESIWTAIDIFAREMGSRMPSSVDPASTCKLQEVTARFLRRRPHVDRTSMHGLLNLLDDWTKKFPKLTQKFWPGDNRKEQKISALAAQEVAMDFVEGAVLPFVRKWKAYLYGLCMELLEQTREEYRVERQRTAELDYSDLLRGAAALLRTDKRVRRELQAKFRWLFVDEFQDTDPVQAEVVLLLAARHDFEGEDWTKAPLRPGTLFVVGDPKQSIYRFRRADIGTYEFVKERIEECGGLLLTLTASFRSVPELCGWTNRAFAQLFPEESSAEQAAFSVLEPVRGAAEGPTAGVFTLTDRTEKKQYGRVSANEAGRIAGLIRESVEQGRYQWGDFLILTSKKAQVLNYSAALEKLRIPVESTGGPAADSHWLSVLKQLLIVLGDPHDAIAAVGVLRGPLFGLSDQELYLHRKEGGRFSLQESSGGHPSVVGALTMLKELYDLARDLPAGAGIERILESSGLLAMASCADPGEGEVPGLLQFADRVRAATLEGRTLAQAMRDVEMAEPERPLSLRVGRQNVVRVMNLHQSKGLQAPVVFLAAPTNGSPTRVDRRIVRVDGQATGFLTLSKRSFAGGAGRVFAAPMDWETHEQEELRYLEAERVRLLYVAATRARDVLVVSRWVHTHGRTTPAWQVFDQFLGEAQELPWVVASGEVPVQQVALDDANEAFLTRTARWSNCKRPSWRRASVTALRGERKIDLVRMEVPPQAYGERKDSGAAWGDLVHRLLEHAMRGPNRSREHLSRLGEWFVFDSPDLNEVIPLAVDAVLEVMATDFWRAAMAAGERLVEVPFGVRSEDGSTLVFGILDLVLKAEDGWDIVDYKTDTRSLDDLVTKYAGQVEQYAQHWATVAGEEVRYAGLFGVRAGELSEDVRAEPAG